MDLTYEKKRRNLMISASAVVAAAFLQLDRPGVLLTAVIGQSTIPAAWRVWFVVLLVLVYQVWRLATDKKTKEIRKAASDFYRGQWSDISRRKLIRLAFKQLRNERTQDTGERRDASSLNINDHDRKHLSLSLHEQSESGQILSITDLMQKETPLTFSVFIRAAGDKSNLPRATKIGELALKHPPSPLHKALWKLRALGATWVHSSDSQDLLVPMGLSALAIIWCALEIISSLTPLQHWT